MAASRFECPRCQTVFVKDIAGDAAFVECPSCGALALPAGDATDGAFSAALSGKQAAPSLSMASTEGEMAPAPLDPAAPMPGMFTDLLSSSVSNPDGAPVGAPPSAEVKGSGNALELDFNFGAELDLPAFPAPPTTGLSREGAAARSSEGRAARSSEGPPVHSLPADAMAALAAEADAGPTEGKKAAPWSGLSEEAFGDLEKAFDEMALKPAPPPMMRGANGLTTDEERFLRDDRSEPSGPVARPPPLRRIEEGLERTGRPRPPPRGSKTGGAVREKRPRPTHFELSAEARQLAFLPIKSEDSMSTSRPRPALEARDRPAPSVKPIASSSSVAEETDLVRGQKADEKNRKKKPVPSPFAGLTVGRAAALILGCAILGGVGGVLAAPKPKVANTAHARAELQFANGNKFYDAGRFDDALGAFRGALSIDPTFALAHRAKGAALAKLSRFDEAAEAYDEYLKLESNPLDGADVKNAIARRRGEAPPK